MPRAPSNRKLMTLVATHIPAFEDMLSSDGWIEKTGKALAKEFKNRAPSQIDLLLIEDGLYSIRVPKTINISLPYALGNVLEPFSRPQVIGEIEYRNGMFSVARYKQQGRVRSGMVVCASGDIRDINHIELNREKKEE
jgi:hypothetical protein